MLMCISIFSVYSVIAVALERYTTVVGLFNKVVLIVLFVFVFVFAFVFVFGEIHTSGWSLQQGGSQGSFLSLYLYLSLVRYTTVVGLFNKVALSVLFTSIVFIINIMFMPRSANS